MHNASSLAVGLVSNTDFKKKTTKIDRKKPVLRVSMKIEEEF